MSIDDGARGTKAAAAPPATERTRECRVSIVNGDRFCTQCGYNLVGQSVVREPHYGMFIVRCPECATVAALQEYPLLGRWAGRWAVVIAFLFFVTLLGAWGASSGALFGISIATAEESSRNYTRHLQDVYQEATAVPPTVEVVTAVPPADGSVPARLTTQVVNQKTFGEWWSEQDRAALLVQRGGWFGAFDKRALWIWLPSGIAVFAIGSFWSVALLTLRRRYLPLWSLALVTVAACFIWIELADWLTDDPSRAWRAGREQIGPGVAALTLGYLMIPLIAGLLVGRSLMRVLVRALLPPRLRYALALLWATDGLEVPGGRRVGSGRGVSRG